MHLNKNLLKLHFTIFIWGFTAILGALIALPALQLVWYRMLIAFISLFLYSLIKGQHQKISIYSILKLGGIGIIVALHWLCFFHSIKVSTISVALVSLSSTALFTGILDPLVNKTKISLIDIFVSLIIIIGIAIIFSFETSYTSGILFGLASAFLAAVFTILNAKEVRKINPVTISAYEMLGGFLLLTLYLFFTSGTAIFTTRIPISDLIYLFILGTICTAFAYVLGVLVMKELSPYTVILTTNLEPVYGILMAFFFFGDNEKMTFQFYIGAFIILLAVFSYPMLKRKLAKNVN